MIRTLIVEDDPMVAQLNEHYLGQVEGFDLIENVVTVDEALKVLEEEDVDLILLDTYMPEKNGFELVMHIRQQELNVDVIFITAARDVDSVKRAIQYGVVDYLIKPFTFERFNDALSLYRDRRLFIAEKKVISQQDLDNVLLVKEAASDMKDLPKGLTKKTLQSVWEAILVIEDEMFSTEDVSSIVGLSRVSIGKYLHFLEDEGILRVKIEYGYVGRPITKYQCVRKSKNRLQNYLT